MSSPIRWHSKIFAPIAPPPIALDNKKNIEMIDAEGNTALHRAVGLKYADLFTYVDPLKYPEHIDENSFIEEMTLLLKTPIDLNIQNNRGDTVLHVVARTSHWSLIHVRLIALLLECGAKADIYNHHNETAVYLAIRGKAPLPTIRALIKNGPANFNKESTLIHQLLDSYPSPFDSKPAAILEILIENGARMDVPDRDGNLPLHLAILRERSHWSIGMLLPPGDAINSRNKEGKAPIHLVMNPCPWHMGSYIKMMLDLLISKGGASIDTQDGDGNTLLHLLIKEKKFFFPRDRREILQFLLAHGADTTKKNLQGKTCIDIANECSDGELVESILAHRGPLLIAKT